MSTNQQIILNTLLEQQKKEIGNLYSEDEYFHLFVTDQLLKNFELSYDEIQQGIVDGGGDGGIDAIYTFVNSELVQSDTDLVDGKRNSVIDVYIIQSKNANGFSESAIEKCTSSALDIFDLTKPIDSLRSIYNSDLLSNVDVFRKQCLHLTSKFPILRFHYFYATKGMEVDPKVSRKVNNLEDAIHTNFDKAEVRYAFLTAGDLIELSRREVIRSKGILVSDNPISTQDGGYIALVPIKNYYDFLSDENSELIKSFFDANIRDYQGTVEVNTAIKDTLMLSKPKEDFWWLNNGITITASDASYSSKKLQIEDPQIVNGLQTSFEIFNYFNTNKVENDDRNVLIRVVKTKDEGSRLRVIKATNSQTNIPPYSLRATDPIHRDIEDYLLPKGYYYDRRKNYHKNQGRPISKIVSIPYLAQVVMSVLHQKPDYARARPSTLIKNDSDYGGIFNSKVPLNLYYICIELHLATEQALKKYLPKLTPTQMGDIRFHVSMYIACRVTDKIKPSADDISGIELALITDDMKKEAIETVLAVYELMGGNNQVAKNKEFVQEVLTELQNKIPRPYAIAQANATKS